MKQQWKKIRAWFFMMWRPILIFLGVALVVSSLYGFHLGSLTNGVSPAERQYVASVSSGKELLKHPVYIVHKAPVYILFKLGVHRVAAYRAISALITVGALVSCFFILREWYTMRIAILGTWLFMASAWMLHVGRLATPESSFLLLMPLLWAAVWLYNTTYRKNALIVLCLLTGASFYVPGFGWLLIITAIWQRKSIASELRAVPVWFRIFCGLVIMLLITPLVYAGINAPRELLLAGGLPDHIPTIKSLLLNLYHVPKELFYHGSSDPARWLANTPVFEVFSIVMLVLGLYSMRYHMKLVRVQLLAGSLAFIGLLVVLGGPVTITALMPMLYILIAGGVAFMLQQWMTVFPRNPIARTTATTLMSVLVLLVSYYHISAYFIAWPQTPATRATFTHTLLK